MATLFKLIFLFFISLPAKADTTVYFFEYRQPDGSIFSFDKEGRFYHTALKYNNQFLEANPYFGVHLEPNITKVGYLKAVLRSSKNIANLDQKITAQLGKKFDLYSKWDDPNSTQCSKLIGQIIGVKPVLFEDGSLTLSPDRLYNQLVKLGFKDCQTCLLHP